MLCIRNNTLEVRGLESDSSTKKKKETSIIFRVFEVLLSDLHVTIFLDLILIVFLTFCKVLQMCVLVLLFSKLYINVIQ